MSIIDLQWKTLFKQKGIDLKKIDSVLPLKITAKDINATKNELGAKARDARLLAKIDTREDLPELFKQLGVFILPIRNGEYIILKGEGFFDIENLSNKIVEFSSVLNCDLHSAEQGDSEMQHLDYSFNTGLLKHHYKSENLYQTIRGRKYTPAFSFNFNGHSINTESVQIEIDGGYESEKILALIEAKNIKTNNFVIRQLYYPYRMWRHCVPSKEIKLSFFSHNNGIYTLHDFSFSKPDNYNSIKQLSTFHYRIVSSRKLNHFNLPLSPSGDRIIPQADDLNKVLVLVDKISKGIVDSHSMAKAMRFEVRQSSYYREAAEALGLVYLDKKANIYNLTEAGKAFISKSENERKKFLANQMINVPIFYEIFNKLLEGAELNRERIAQLIMENSTLNSVTARRRTATIVSWLKWFQNNIGLIEITENKIALA